MEVSHSKVQIPPASEEQQAIVDALGKYNIIVDSVAGSGKTTTIMHIAQGFQCDNVNDNIKKVLIITYNRKLSIETKERIRLLKLTNVSVYTYHAFCMRYYRVEDYTDKGIMNAVDKQYPIQGCPYASCEVLVIDEAQDMRPYYLRFLHKVVRDLGIKPRICVLGDARQTIYQFNGSDARFIMHADSICMFNDYEWKSLKLTKSYRLTTQIATFINRCMLGEDRIIGHGNGPNVKYHYMNIFNIKSILKMIQGHGKDDDIFILVPSVRSSKRDSPVVRLVNECKNMNFYVASSDDGDVTDDEELRNKTAVLTYHQSKGLERKIVVIFNFDSTYFDFYARDESPHICPNIMYVAASRAKEQLIVIHARDRQPMPFMKDITKYCDIIGKSKKDIAQSPKKLESHSYDVTALIRHIPQIVIDQCMKHIHTTNVRDKMYDICPTNKIKSKQTIEVVDDLLGISVAAFIEACFRGVKGTAIYMTVESLINQYKPSIEPKVYEAFHKPEVTPSYMNIVATLYSAIKHAYFHRTRQIKSYDWITVEDIMTILTYAKGFFTVQSQYEVGVGIDMPGCRITGRMDIVEKQHNIIYEMKFTSNITDEHYIQLALYKVLYEQAYPNEKYRYQLYNIRTGQIVEIDVRDGFDMLMILVKHKMTTVEVVDTEKFISEQRSTLLCDMGVDKLEEIDELGIDLEELML